MSPLAKAFFLIRKAVYVSLSFVDRVFQRKNRVFILAYHGINRDNWRFSVDPEVFKRQIQHVKKQYTFITLGELYAYMAGKKQLTSPSVVLTIDDGYRDILGVKDFLMVQNIRPTLFLLSDPEHVNEKELGTKAEFLSARDIKLLVHDGWEIGCHSATHGNLAEPGNLKESEQLLRAEIIESKKRLENELGIRIPYFAYPRGKYNEGVVATVKKAGYALAVTMDDGFITQTTNPLLVPRIGIDRTHSFAEFAATVSPSVVMVRRLIKNSFLGRYL